MDACLRVLVNVERFEIHEVVQMGLQENIARETVDQLALRKAIPLSGNQTVRDAVVAMRAGGLGCAILVDEQSKPIGLLTEAMLRKAISRNPHCIDEPLSDHVATTFPWVRTSDPIETVLDAMEAKNHRFVVVVDDAGTVVNVTGQKGLMEYVADHFSEEVMVQRIGTAPYPHRREGA